MRVVVVAIDSRSIFWIRLNRKVIVYVERKGAIIFDKVTG